MPAAPAACALPWGGSLGSGQSVTAYQTNVSANCAAAAETRACNNGTLSGRYVNPICSAAPPNYAITADLALKAKALKKVKSGRAFRYTIQVANKSTNPVSEIRVTGAFENNAVSIELPSFCGATNQEFTCQLGKLNGKKRKAFTLRVKPNDKGTLRFNATVAGQANDPLPTNNTSALSTQVR